MRGIVVVVALGACGGTTKPVVPLPRAEVRDTFGSLYYRLEPEAGRTTSTMLIIDHVDPGFVTTRIAHVDTRVPPTFSSNMGRQYVLGVPLVGTDGELLTQFYAPTIMQPINATHEAAYVAVSPRLKRVAVWRSKAKIDATYDLTYGVPAGSEDGLYLPITSDGQLAWFPDGVIGAKPMFNPWDNIELREPQWGYWLVRWGAPVPGWSIARRRDLSDLNRYGPQWTETKEDRLTSEYEPYALIGTRADGTCDVEVVHQATAYDHAWPHSTHAATCADALHAMRDRNGALRREANRERIAAENAEWARRAEEERLQARRERERAAQPVTAPEDEASLIARYQSLINTAGSQSVVTAEACAVISRVRAERHVSLVESRKATVGLASGELACLKSREGVDRYEGRIDAMEGYARARSQEHTTYSYDSPGDDGYADESARMQKKTDAMREYTHGSGKGSVCPFERALCK